MHIVTRMAIVIHAHVRTHAICSSCAGMESAFSKKSAVASCCCQEINIVCFYESFCREQNNIDGALKLYNLENVKKCEFITELCIFFNQIHFNKIHLMEFNIFQLINSFFFKPPQDVTLLLCCFAKSYLHSCTLNQNNQALKD